MNSPHRLPSYEEQKLYDHLITYRKLESPEALLERFYNLFVDGTRYPEPGVLETLHKLATSRLAEQEFKFVLNRCCRILINYWWFQPPFRWAIAELVYLLQTAPPVRATYINAQRLRSQVQKFTATEEFQSLQRLAQVVVESTPDSVDGNPHPNRHFKYGNETAAGQPRSLRHLIHRYPYLYPYCLGSYSSDQEFDTIRQLQAERQQKFECDLSRYVTHLIHQSSSNARPSAKVIQNPTLLSDEQLKTTIKHFTGQDDRTGTYSSLARRFLAYSAQVDSYRTFKEGLYRYLMSSIEATNPRYSKHYFDQWLQTQLKNTLPQSDTQSLNSVLISRTCQQLLDSLVASPQNVGSHLMFVDLITNVGATVTVGLLLKLLLLYNNLKSNLEKRLAVLFKHYELVTDGVDWLVESLENLQIAFSIHFGSVSLPRF